MVSPFNREFNASTISETFCPFAPSQIIDPRSGPQCLSIIEALPVTSLSVSSRERHPEIQSAVSCPKLWPTTALTSSPQSIQDLAEEYWTEKSAEWRVIRFEIAVRWKMEGYRPSKP